MNSNPTIGEVYLHSLHGVMCQVVGFIEDLPNHAQVLYEGSENSNPRLTRIEFLVEI